MEWKSTLIQPPTTFSGQLQSELPRILKLLPNPSLNILLFNYHTLPTKGRHSNITRLRSCSRLDRNFEAAIDYNLQIPNLEILSILIPARLPR